MRALAGTAPDKGEAVSLRMQALVELNPVWRAAADGECGVPHETATGSGVAPNNWHELGSFLPRHLATFKTAEKKGSRRKS
jgi:hypothetical protein